MNRCAQLDETLHKYVPRKSLEPIEFQGHRSMVKVIFFVRGRKFTKMFLPNVEKKRSS